jgi:iron(III) transport system substrate-binding protein
MLLGKIIMNKTAKTSVLSGISRRDLLRMAAGSGAMIATSGLWNLPRVLAQGATGSISVYSALNETTNNAFIEAFNQEHPDIQVELLPLAAAGELQTRIRTESASPNADVFIGGSSEFHDPLGKEGLLLAYQSPNAAAVAPLYKDPNGFWTGWYLGVFGFVYNTDRFSEEMGGMNPPATWDDLLDPAWQGKLAYPDPTTTGGGYIFIATQIFRFAQQLGLIPSLEATPEAGDMAEATAEATITEVDYTEAEAAAMEYMAQLHQNIAQYVGTSPQAIQLVGQGQFVGAPNWSHDILTAKSQGNPVELAVPVDTAHEIGAISIVNGGPNPEAAKVFVDWVLTRPAGELNVQLSNRLSVLPDVPPAPGAPTLESVSLVNYDRAWASDNKDRILRMWQEATGGA